MQPEGEPRPGEAGGPTVREVIFISLLRSAGLWALWVLVVALMVGTAVWLVTPGEQRTVNYFIYQLHVRLAGHSSAAGDHRAALRRYGRAIKRDPGAEYVPFGYQEWVSAYGLRADVYFKIGDLRHALADYDAACRFRGGASRECLEGKELRRQYGFALTEGADK